MPQILKATEVYDKITEKTINYDENRILKTPMEYDTPGTYTLPPSKEMSVTAVAGVYLILGTAPYKGFQLPISSKGSFVYIKFTNTDDYCIALRDKETVNMIYTGNGNWVAESGTTFVISSSFSVPNDWPLPNDWKANIGFGTYHYADDGANSTTYDYPTGADSCAITVIWRAADRAAATAQEMSEEKLWIRYNVEGWDASWEQLSTSSATETLTNKTISYADNTITGVQPTISGAASSIASSDLTASKALISDANGKVAVSSVASTELGYVSGVTSSIQNQINAKQGTLSQTQLNAVNSGIDSTKVGQIATNTSDISEINGKIPSAATTSNQLADKAFVNSSINNMAANYITSDVAGDNFATKAALTTGPYYYKGQVYTPTTNDYALVEADETKSGATTRYIYDGSQWAFQYVVNNTPFTQSQQDAINSGITSNKVSGYDTHITDSDIHVTTSEKSSWSGKQDAISGAASTIASADLTVSKALISDANGKVAASSVTDTELGYLSGVTSSIQTQIGTKANDNAVVHIAGSGNTAEEITGVKSFTYGHSGAQDDNNPGVRASRLRIIGQVAPSASQKSVSQVDFYLGDENLGYMGCTKQNNKAYLKVASANKNIPLIFGYLPYTDNTSCLRFEQAHPVWRGGQTGTWSEDKNLAVVGDIKTGTYTMTNKTIAFSGNTLTGVASTDTAQTLTNKTISYADNTLTGVASTNTSQTLTNKTIDGADNTLKITPTVYSSNTTLTPSKEMIAVIDTANVVLTLGNGPYIGYTLPVFASASCSVSYTGSSGATSQTLTNKQNVKFIWNGSEWICERIVLMEGTYTDNTPFSFNVVVRG